MTSDAVSAALAEFPELCRLVDLRDAGWQFIPTVEHGEVTKVRGVRVWSGMWTDAIVIKGPGDAGGMRLDPDGGVVGDYAGGVVDVVDFLVTMPAPDSPGAPRLVKARGPALWVPPSP